MFSDELELYLKDWWPEVDGSKRVVKLRLYLNPVTHERALEVAEDLADAIFKKNGNVWEPRQVVQSFRFVKTLPAYSMGLRRHPDYAGDKIFVPTCLISNLCAEKVIPGKPDFAFMFTVTFEIQDRSVTRDLTDLLQEKLWVNFKLLQGEIQFPEPEKFEGAVCRLCSAPNPEWKVKGENAFYCSTHVDNRDHENEPKVERIRPDKDQAVAAVRELVDDIEASAAEEEGTPSATAGTVAPGTDLLKDHADDGMAAHANLSAAERQKRQKKNRSVN